MFHLILNLAAVFRVCVKIQYLVDNNWKRNKKEQEPALSHFLWITDEDVAVVNFTLKVFSEKILIVLGINIYCNICRKYCDIITNV